MSDERIRVYGWKATAMAHHLSRDELHQLQATIKADPRNANPSHATGQSIYLYTDEAMKKLDAIGWAITYQLKAEKERS